LPGKKESHDNKFVGFFTDARYSSVKNFGAITSDILRESSQAWAWAVSSVAAFFFFTNFFFFFGGTLIYNNPTVRWQNLELIRIKERAQKQTRWGKIDAGECM